LGGRKDIRPVKNGGWWRFALVSSDGVAPSRMVGVSASVIFPCTILVQKKFFFWHWLSRIVLEKGRKMVLYVCVWMPFLTLNEQYLRIAGIEKN